MAKADDRGVREGCDVINDGWFAGAKGVDSNGISQAVFLEDVTAADDNAAIAYLEAKLKMKREVRDDKYRPQQLTLKSRPRRLQRQPALRLHGRHPKIRPSLGSNDENETVRGKAEVKADYGVGFVTRRLWYFADFALLSILATTLND